MAISKDMSQQCLLHASKAQDCIEPGTEPVRSEVACRLQATTMSNFVEALSIEAQTL